jgi:predicted Zn-dependent protease with MMP-like domain
MNIKDVIAEVLRQLPLEVKEKLAGVTYHVAQSPSAELLELGIGVDEAGAYVQVGDDDDQLYDEEEAPERHIWLFAENIQPLTRARVIDVLIHEIGHACGLDEEALRALGLGPS